MQAWRPSGRVWLMGRRLISCYGASGAPLLRMVGFVCLEVSTGPRQKRARGGTEAQRGFWWVFFGWWVGDGCVGWTGGGGVLGGMAGPCRAGTARLGGVWSIELRVVRCRLLASASHQAASPNAQGLALPVHCTPRNGGCSAQARVTDQRRWSLPPTRSALPCIFFRHGYKNTAGQAGHPVVRLLVTLGQQEFIHAPTSSAINEPR